MANTPRRFDSFFCESTLHEMTATVATQEELLRQVRAALPNGLRGQYLHCLRKNDTLIIQVRSAAQATLMRFHSSALLEKILTTDGTRLRKIQIRTLPASVSITPKPSIAKRPSKATANQLIESAESCESEEIKSALKRLGLALVKIETDSQD
jgi:hypothetical protein